VDKISAEKDPKQSLAQLYPKLRSLLVSQNSKGNESDSSMLFAKLKYFMS